MGIDRRPHGRVEEDSTRRMKVVFDASVLLLVMDANAKPPPNPKGHGSAKTAMARVEHLLGELDAQAAIAIVPAPSFSELLIRATRAFSVEVDRILSLQDTRHIQRERFGLGKRRWSGKDA